MSMARGGATKPWRRKGALLEIPPPRRLIGRVALADDPTRAHLHAAREGQRAHLPLKTKQTEIGGPPTAVTHDPREIVTQDHVLLVMLRNVSCQRTNHPHKGTTFKDMNWLMETKRP